MKTIDACGRSCPEPLVMLKSALKTESNFILLVDSQNAMENCSDFARKNNYKVDVQSENSVYSIKISK